VQILDPATGTGTFLAEAIARIAEKVQGMAPGKWSGYVEESLIPRLHGFELLMASYAMCHMKLDMVLTELGYKPIKAPRLGVYLTNSLEEGERDVRDLFMAQWLTREAREANTIKRQMPIMCVIGNPPYSGHSSNKGKWISGLMEPYKKSPELKRPAQAKWLSDDYVKFIRLAEHFIERTGEGVLGFITNHSYLDNPTFLDMRHHLMQTFDQSYVLDLHGNSKKKEVAPDGSPDKNVFDIMQGVAILIGVKHQTQKTKGKPLARVMHAELWGSRAAKNTALEAMTISASDFMDVTPDRAPWPFKAQDWALKEKYEEFPGIADWFSPNGRPAPGIVTTQDQFAISWSETEAIRKVERFLKTSSESEARTIWRLCSQDQWDYERAMIGLSDGAWRKRVVRIAYRPFDPRFTVYDSNVAVHRRERVSGHMLAGMNLGLATARSNKNPTVDHFYVVDTIMETKCAESSTQSVCFPLYLYPTEQDLDQTCRINLDPKLWKKLRGLASDAEHGVSCCRFHGHLVKLA
jgi:predicted helicase